VWRAIVFDGDDTLWRTEQLYDDARRQARGLVEGAGLDGALWEQLERQIDVENVEVRGLGLDRFPASCADAYEKICLIAGERVDSALRSDIYEAARSVFQREAPLVPEARETLAALAGHGLKLLLLTRGDPALQRRRIEQSGLVDLFDAIEIVERKTPETITTLIESVGVQARDALSVGNSVRSDVLPSLAAGVRPIWIDAHVWEYERDHDDLPPDAAIELSDLPSVVDFVT
jgi:putative hydrolase of the HAD superfamily